MLLWDIAGIAHNVNIKFELPSYAKIDKNEELDNWQKKSTGKIRAIEFVGEMGLIVSFPQIITVIFKKNGKT